MDHKSDVRARVWNDLRQVAVPDSRFHYNFGEFIADFDGGAAACDRLVAHRHYQNAEIIFIAPDNCVERLRERALADGKTVLMTTYSIKRGFWLLEPKAIGPENFRLASMLDAMERFARPVTLAKIAQLPRVDYLVTGTGAINHDGVRFGKGHGFFDVEWAMLFEMGRIAAATPVAAMREGISWIGSHQWLQRAAGDRDIRRADHVQHARGICCAALRSQVTRHRGDRADLDFRRGMGQRDGHRVVDAGIAIDQHRLGDGILGALHHLLASLA